MGRNSLFTLDEVNTLKQENPALTDAQIAEILGVKPAAISQKKAQARKAEEQKKQQTQEKTKAKKTTQTKSERRTTKKTNLLDEEITKELAKMIAPIKFINVMSKLYNIDRKNNHDSIRVTDQRYNFLKEIIGFNYDKDKLRTVLRLSDTQSHNSLFQDFQ